MAVDQELAEAFSKSAQRQIDDLSKSAQSQFDKLIAETKEKLDRIEEKTAADIRFRGFTIGGAVIGIALFGVLSGVLSARHEVEKSVIDLNKDIIAAQATVIGSRTEINNAIKDLNTSRSDAEGVKRELVELRSKLDIAIKEYNNINQSLSQARAAYNAILSDIDKLYPASTWSAPDLKEGMAPIVLVNGSGKQRRFKVCNTGPAEVAVQDDQDGKRLPAGSCIFTTAGGQVQIRYLQTVGKAIGTFQDAAP